MSRSISRDSIMMFISIIRMCHDSKDYNASGYSHALDFSRKMFDTLMVCDFVESQIELGNASDEQILGSFSLLGVEVTD